MDPSDPCTSEPPQFVKPIFEVLLRDDVHFCDSNGSMLGDAESREFILGVENADFRNDYLHPYSI